jgi:hypothetical protein
MSAAFGQHLIFDLNGCCACRFQFLDGSSDLDGLAKAGIRIHDHGDRYAPRQLSRMFGEFLQSKQAHVGQSQHARGKSRSRDVGGGESRALDEHSGQRAGRAGYGDRGRTGSLSQRLPR